MLFFLSLCIFFYFLEELLILIITVVHELWHDDPWAKLVLHSFKLLMQHFFWGEKSISFISFRAKWLRARSIVGRCSLPQPQGEVADSRVFILKKEVFTLICGLGYVQGSQFGAISTCFNRFNLNRIREQDPTLWSSVLNNILFIFFEAQKHHHCQMWPVTHI